MKRFFSKISVLAVCTALASVSWAGSPIFTHVRSVDYLPHCCVGNLMAAVKAPNGSSIYFGDWFDDDIFYVATPLTTDGTNNDIANTIEAQDTAGTWSSGGWSFQGGGVDGNNIVIGGANAADTQLSVITQTSPGVWSNTQVTGISGIYSGPSVVGTNKIVMANYATGALQFFNLSSGVASTNGAPIANPNIGTGKALSSLYDATSGKIFVYIVDTNLTRRIDIFNSNGTPAGTSYVGTWATGVASTLVPAGSGATSHNRSAQMAINQKYRILIAPFRDGVNEGWDVFNISTVGATGTPYKQLRSADLNTTGYTGTGRDLAGSADFSTGGNDYQAFTFWNKLAVLQLTPGSSVDGWSLY